MPQDGASLPTRNHQPLILIRGFGGLGVEEEKKLTYQGFNDGTVYPHKRGENYIYEGLILRFVKSDWQYQDATNVVGYYSEPAKQEQQLPDELNIQVPEDLRDQYQSREEFFFGDRVIIDPGMALYLQQTMKARNIDPCRSIWVFRYYDLNDRKFKTYGEMLVRLIDFIRALATHQNGTAPKVNIIAHSMGGLIVREAIQRTYPESTSKRKAENYINKVVTLGTPHQGITFQVLDEWIPPVKAEEELEHFSPEFQRDKGNAAAYVRFSEFFPPERLLTVVGTNYRSYLIKPSSWLNRLFSVSGEFGANYNRSDGLVKQAYAQIPNAPRTFVHKCHGGPDSLTTARESFEVATRFFFGDIRARLRMMEAKVMRGMDLFGKSEFFFGVTIKPRGVDFELFHQSAEAENSYGPFSSKELSDEEPRFGWAGENKLIWEGWLDTEKIRATKGVPKNLVFRIDFYVGERDVFGVGFSDNVIFRRQYYTRAVLESELKLYLYPDERFAKPNFKDTDKYQMETRNGGWHFKVGGDKLGFTGEFRIELDEIPKVGHPEPLQR